MSGLCKKKLATQVERQKTEDCQGKAHFEAMPGARVSYFRQSTAIVLF